MSNRAAWINQEKASLSVAEAEMPTPGPNEILVKNSAIALNPVEAKVQKLAIFSMSYPTVLGMSFAGTVSKVGSSVTSFKVGDRVTVKRSTKGMKPAFGAFQHYALADPLTTSKLEDNTSFAAGASVVTNLATAVSALTLSLGLDRPNPAGPNPANKNKKVLVYGGSSSTGGFAVNYATAAGYSVVTTSSPQHAAFVSSLGPHKVVDHTQAASSIVSELKAAGPYDAVFDAIGLDPVIEILGQVLKERGGVIYTTLPPMGLTELPSNVRREMESYPSVMENPENAEFREWFYGALGAFLETKNGRKLVAPEKIDKIEGGLEGIQGGLDRLFKGVSGKKLVVEL